jgi:ERCC4-type nuclease
MLLIDAREQDMVARVIKRAQAEKVEYEVQELDCGDYIWTQCDSLESPICIERKKVGDLIQSKRNGRLDNQLKRMNAQFPFSYLFVVGKFENIYLSDRYIKGWTAEHTKGLKASISAKYPFVHMVEVPNDTQLIDLIFLFKDKFEQHKELREASQIELKFTKKKVTDLDPNFVHFCQLAGIGEKKAEEIVKIYPSFLEFLLDAKNDNLKIKVPMSTRQWLKRMCKDAVCN